MQVPCQIYALQMYSLILWIIFTLLTVSFEAQMFLILIVSKFISFFCFPFFFFFGHATQLAGSWFPDQGLNPDPVSESSES